MIIFSQDKTNIINMDNIGAICINNYGQGKEIHAFGNEGKIVYILGKYANNDRAKMMLKKIYNAFEYKQKAFIMPIEWVKGEKNEV